VAKKTKPSTKERPRGGASVPCPRCGAATQVLTTRRVEGVVTRRRQCTSCEEKFETKEETT
jgi:transcriptional regulator NrdR family protein